MLIWTKLEDVRKVRVVQQRPYLIYCPEWCPEGYVVAEWNGKTFEYSGDNNGTFSEHVEKFAPFFEAD